MDTVKLLLLTVLPAVALGCLVGVFVGKHRVKKAANQLNPVLNRSQRIVSAISILVGAVLITLGIILPIQKTDEENWVDGGMDFGLGDDAFFAGEDGADLPMMGGDGLDYGGGDIDDGDALDDPDNFDDEGSDDEDLLDSDDSDGEDALEQAPEADVPAVSSSGGGGTARNSGGMVAIPVEGYEVRIG